MGTSSVIELVAFVVGLFFGSFLNVCISRLPKHESIVRPGSHCPHCGKPIRPYDNIPVLSWILLRGQCRDCGTPISWRYPLVEFATGVWFFVVAHFAPDDIKGFFGSVPSFVLNPTSSIQVVSLALLGFLLIGLMVMDWQTMKLPDAFTLSGIVIGLLLVCIQAIFLGRNEDQVRLTKHSIHLTAPGGVTDAGNVFLTGPETLIFGRLAAFLGAALLLLAVRWTYQAVRHREGMGMGDVKLLAMIAAFLGFWPAVLSLFFGSLLASVYGIFLLIRGRAIATSKLPFGSFLCGGGLFAALYGNRLIDMYIALLR